MNHEKHPSPLPSAYRCSDLSTETDPFSSGVWNFKSMSCATGLCCNVKLPRKRPRAEVVLLGKGMSDSQRRALAEGQVDSPGGSVTLKNNGQDMDMKERSYVAPQPSTATARDGPRFRTNCARAQDSSCFI